MPRLRIILIILVLAFWAFPSLLLGSGDKNTLYQVSLEGAVEYGLKSYLERAFREAEAVEASAILLEINTPGGRVDAAQEIRDMIVEAPVPVYAYVKPHALSAGAYLAMACDALYMAPGATLGAAEPRLGLEGEEVDEKTLSAWEADMITVAEMRGRDPEIAAAMVRREISIPGVVESGKLLTLTSQKALDLGFIDGVFDSRVDLLNYLNYGEATVIEGEMSGAEVLARFITHPVTSTLLLTIGFAALVLEIMTAGFGVAGSIGVLSFTLYFGGHIIAGLAGYEVVILFIMGIILLIVEAFVTGFGILGAGGIAAMVGSILLSATSTGEGLRNLLISTILAGLIIAISLRYLVKSNWLQNVILSYKEEKDLGYVGPMSFKGLMNKEGVTLTTLRPSGTAEIEGERVDVVSEGGYIPRQARVRVVNIEGPRVLVREIKEEKEE